MEHGRESVEYVADQVTIRGTTVDDKEDKKRIFASNEKDFIF